MRGPWWRSMLCLLVCAVTASCTAPPVTFYVPGASEARGTAMPLRPNATVIELARVTVPDYLDTEDILVRRGTVLDSSHTGRWASRLSLGATEFLAGRLALTRPDALVTSQPQTSAPTYRLSINISRLDIATDGPAAGGRAILEADWLLVPRDGAVSTRRDRVRLNAASPVGDDQQVVALETTLLSRLASSIDISRLP